MAEPHIVVLGGGPAGVGGAFQLRRLGRARVTLVEQRDVVGGNAGSFAFGPHRMDYGSHRLHPACDPAVLADIRELLDGDLLVRPRHGRIRLRGRWIHFPLQPADLLLHGDPAFTAGAMRDMVLKPLRAHAADGEESFASVLRVALGPTICDDFYFPYARKIWGRAPETLSAIQARRRVSAGSFGKLLKKIFSKLPGLRQPMTGRFFYPRRGYGQISEAYAAAAAGRGAELLLGWTVTALEPQADRAGWCVGVERNGERRTLAADHVWSTLPISLLARLVSPPPPADVRAAAAQMQFRAMLLVLLELDTDRFTEYDAHYFPDEQTAITRLSEPKNYAARRDPPGRTAICAELPCDTTDAFWSMSDAELASLVAADLERVGFRVPAVTAVTVRRLSHAYPIYEQGYEDAFGVLDRWAENLPGMLTYGRQGLFAHDNTHHALFMAYSAAECIREDGTFDADRWAGFRKIFETHVVED